MKILFALFLVCFSFAKAFAEEPFPLNKFREAKPMETPLITRKDIPRLLKISESTDVISECPQNLLSSRYVEHCLMGTVALWAIEVARQGKIPSLNPILSDRKRTDLSEKELLAKARAVYQKWWEKGGKGDPLKGTNLRWD